MAGRKGRKYDLTSVSSRPTERLDGPPKPLPSKEQRRQWERQYWEEWPGRQQFQEDRGWSDETARTAHLGYYNTDPRGEVITIPLADNRGIYNLKRKYLDGKKPKYMAIDGRPHRLYPGDPTDEHVITCEGEPDALILRQHGFDAVTCTAGVWGWNDRFLADHAWKFEGRDVSILFDAGWQEFELAEKLANQLKTAGARVAVAVDLTFAQMRPGEDVTDFFVKYGGDANELDKFIDWSWNYWNKEQAA